VYIEGFSHTQETQHQAGGFQNVVSGLTNATTSRSKLLILLFIIAVAAIIVVIGVFAIKSKK
jgi:hypothetical protein